MRVYNIEYDRMFIVRAVCPEGHSLWFCLLHAGEWFMEDQDERRKKQRKLGVEVEVFHGAQRRGCSFSMDKKNGNSTKRIRGEETIP